MKSNFIPNRENIILPLCKGKSVLEIGCFKPSPIWFHDKICAIARECIGMDINEEYCQKGRELGYNIVCGDGETINLGKKFDVIVVRMLEAVSNQGIFLENMKNHLTDGGILILAAPNMFCPKYLLYQLFGNFEKLGMSPDHTLWHSEETLKTIVERHGWGVKEIYYTYIKSRPWWIRILMSICSCFIPARFIGTTITAVLEKNLE